MFLKFFAAANGRPVLGSVMAARAASTWARSILIETPWEHWARGGIEISPAAGIEKNCYPGLRKTGLAGTLAARPAKGPNRWCFNRHCSGWCRHMPEDPFLLSVRT